MREPPRKGLEGFCVTTEKVTQSILEILVRERESPGLCSCCVNRILTRNSRRDALLNSCRVTTQGVDAEDEVERRSVAGRGNRGQFSMAFLILAVKGRTPFTLRGARNLYYS